MGELLDRIPEDEKDLIRSGDQPYWTAPMLATLTSDRFSDENWFYERKLDGERCLAFIGDGGTRLMSRNRKVVNSSYPEIVEAYSRMTSHSCILDGEVVAFKGGVTSFEKLQARMHVEDPDEAKATGVKVFHYLFDILWLDGYDVCDLPLRTRKSLLLGALDFDDPVRFTPHRVKNGMEYFREACRKNWEGLVVKRADSRYQHKRSRAWLKFKRVNEQEMVIGGYTDPEGSRVGFGALLVGYYRGDELRYAGKVGTGYDDATLERLVKRLEKIEVGSSPFSEKDVPSRGVHWVRPELVAEIGFMEWTKHGRLRHPRFLGMRRDKSAKDVVKEKPAQV